MSDNQRVPAAGILWDWQIIEALQETIKPEQISARPDGKDYVEWHEATRIANRVFGPLGWSLTTTMTPTLLSLGNWGEGFFCTRKITVRYRCSEDSLVYSIERDGEGWIKMQAIGKSDAIDMAFKGAASDAISKATKTFGDAFGLSIYAPKGRHAATSKQENKVIRKPTPQEVEINTYLTEFRDLYPSYCSKTPDWKSSVLRKALDVAENELVPIPYSEDDVRRVSLYVASKKQEKANKAASGSAA